MPILPSAARRIHALLERLDSTAAAERESAVAQLTLLGPRILSHFPGFLGRAPRAARIGVIETLERLGSTNGLAILLGLTRDRDEDVALRAVEAAAAFVDRRTTKALAGILASRSPALRGAALRSLSRLHARGLAETIEPLLEVLLDGEDDDSLRLAALEALSTLEPRTLLPALQRLAGDKSQAVARAADLLAARVTGAPPSTDVLLARLVSPRTPASEAPEVIAALVSRRSPALVPALKRRLEELGREPARDGAGREAVARAKARVHLALGALGSRIALHDLRDLLRARPLCASGDLLAAAEQVGDASFVPGLAALAADEPRLAEAAGRAFGAIARREGLRRSSRAITSLRPEHRAALEPLWPSRRAASNGTRSRRRARGGDPDGRDD